MGIHTAGRLAPLAIASTLLVSTMAVGGAAAETTRGGCGVGFDIGAITIDEAVALERTQAAIDDGLIAESQIRASYVGIDADDNGVICAQLPHGFEVGSRPYGQYFYNFVDDNAAAHDG